LGKYFCKTRNKTQTLETGTIKEEEEHQGRRRGIRKDNGR
jgi:hypothetical protein